MDLLACAVATVLANVWLLSGVQPQVPRQGALIVGLVSAVLARTTIVT